MSLRGYLAFLVCRARAVLFDLDGTLIDSRGDIAAACNHVLVWSGRSALPEETVASYVGDGARSLLSRAFGMERSSPELEPLLSEWTRYYAAHPVERSTWMPGAVEAMAAAEALGAKLGLVTNKMRVVTNKIVEALGVTKRFGAIVGGGDARLKPNAEPVLLALRTLDVAPADAWMVGDAAQDVGAGRAAGCLTVAVRGGFQPDARLAASEPAVMLGSMHEVAELLAQPFV